MNSNIVDVGIGDIKVCSAPDKLRTVLGSCVALCIYDRKNKIAGLAHVVLPRYKGKGDESRFGDRAYGILIKMMTKKGADKTMMFARLAGGARMQIVKESSPYAKIGLENADVVRNLLQRDRIPVFSENIGGEKGISVTFSAENGELTIRTLSYTN